MEENSKDSKRSEVAEVAKELIGWEDNKLFNTLKDLTIKPGEMARNFCNGDTNKYLSPIAYFLGVTGLVAYLSSITGLNDAIIEGSMKSFDANSLKKADKDMVLIKDKLGLILSFLLSEVGQKIILIPPLLLFTWGFYKKATSSFKENSWVALYVLAHASLISLPFIIIWYFTKEIGYYTICTTLIWYLLWIWASKGFYDLKLGKAIFKGTLLFVTYNLIYIVVVSLISMVIIL